MGDAIYWMMHEASPRLSLKNYQYAFRIRGNSEVFLFNTPYVIDWTVSYWNGLDQGHATFEDTETVNLALTQHALYRLFGCEELVMAEPLIQFPHNYNYPSRAVMYRWMNQHLGLNLADAERVEKDFEPLTREELTVWDAEHPQPPGGDEGARVASAGVGGGR